MFHFNLKSFCCRILFILFFFRFDIIYSQITNNSFRLMVSAGIVGSQVDGDAYGGYNKAGIFAGIFTVKPISDRSQIEFGLSYIQKGSRKNINPKAGDYTFYLLRLNYVELPLTYSYIYKEKYIFQGGLSMAYLAGSNEESHVGKIKVPFKNNDLSYHVGLRFKTTDNLFFGIRYSYSLVPIRNFNANGIYLGTFWTRIFNRGLYNNLIQLSVNYKINPKDKKSD